MTGVWYIHQLFGYIISYGTSIAIDQQNSRSPNMDPFGPNRKKQMPGKAVAKWISINIETPKTQPLTVALTKMVQFPRFFPRWWIFSVVNRQVVTRSSPTVGFSQETFWPQGSLPRRSSRGRTRKAWVHWGAWTTHCGGVFWMRDWGWMGMDGVSVFLGGVGWEIGLGMVCLFFFGGGWMRDCLGMVCVSSVFVRFFCVFFLGFLGVIWGYFVHVSDGSYSPVASMNVHSYCLSQAIPPVMPGVWKPFLKCSEKTPSRRCEWVSV